MVRESAFVHGGDTGGERLDRAVAEVESTAGSRGGTGAKGLHHRVRPVESTAGSRGDTGGTIARG